MIMELSSPEAEIALPQPADIMASLQRADDDDDWTSTTATAAADEEPPQPDEELPQENRRTSSNNRNRRGNTRNNNTNISSNADIHEDDIRAEIQRFNQARRSTSRYRQQSRIRSSRSRRPIIQPVESTEAQTKQIIYMGISVIIIGGIMLVLLRYKGKALNLVCLIGLMCCIVYLYLKFQRLRQIQRLSIHENSQFSYAVSDSGNNIEQDDSPRPEEEFQDNLRASSSQSARRNPQAIRDQISSRRLMRSNQFFMELLLQSLRQSVLQLGAAISQEGAIENGYSEEQINGEIKGACKYGELQLKGENNDKSCLIDKSLIDNEGEEGFKVTEKDENTCVICLEGYGENSDVRILKCKHFFHVFCLDEWLKKKKECPVCRQPPLVEDPSQQEQQQQQQPSSILNQQAFNGHEIIIPMSHEILQEMLSRNLIRGQHLLRVRQQPLQHMN